MSSKKQTKKVYEPWQSNGNSNFMQIFHDFFDSAAWASLNASDRDLYLHMLRKHQRKVISGNIESSNCNNISMVREEYEKFMNARTFSKSIDNLIEAGFIKMVKWGYPTRSCNIYAFNDAWKQYGTKNFEVKAEWRRKKKT
jgi:hypothetical protein